MAISNMNVLLKCDIQKVWEVVVSLENYSWRSDLDRIEIVDDRRFIAVSYTHLHCPVHSRQAH